MWEVAGANCFSDLYQQFEISGGSSSLNNPAQYLFEPGAAFSAWHTFPAGFVGIKLGLGKSRRGDVGRFVHHHDRAGSQHGSLGANLARFEW